MSGIALRPMGAAQIVGAALRLVRQRPALFGGLALCGAAPLAALVLALHHVAMVRGGARPSPSTAVALCALGVTLALFARAFAHAAILRALAGVLGGNPAGAGQYLTEARTTWLPSLVVGGFAGALGLLSGFVYFTPVPILGGVVLLALPRVVLDDRGVWAALTGRREAIASGRVFSVNFLYCLLAAGIFANLYLLVQLVLALGRTFFDLDVSFLGSVLSLDNSVYVVTLAAVTVVLLEPVRVLSAGLLHLEAKVRREGLDLAARLADLEQAPRRRSERPARAAMIAFLAGAVALGASRADASALDARDAAVAIGADLAERSVGPSGPSSPKLERVRKLAGTRRDAPGERGAFWRTVGAELAEIEALPESGKRARAAALGERLATESLHGASPRAILDEVLARPEYARLDPSLWDEAPRPPSEEDRDLEPDIPLRGGGAGGGVSGFTVLAILLAVAAVGTALALAGVSWKSRRRAPAPTPPLGSAAPIAEHVDALARDPEEWRAEADALAARGDYRGALRRLYLAVLVSLHRARLIEYDPSRTNGEYLRRFAGPREARMRFRDLTRTFDFVWYGERPVTPEGYSELAQSAGMLWRESAARGAA